PLIFAPNTIHGNPFVPYTVILHSTTGTGKILSQISIYPNPASSRLYISRNVETIDLVEIINLSGQTVMLQKDYNAASIDVSPLESGMYLIRITVNKETVVKMFIKER
ncbi:MAG: T9SS type A sorting domain-containing protein, partial [Methanobrevibacter sp.]|nr:T9SS type A sorting domain-containing protein [Methanobrevibacter sp.]